MPTAGRSRPVAQAALPGGNAEHFAGYAILAVPFASGDVLAMRRWTATSISPAQISVWHRSPDGEWTFYSNVAPVQSCARYFSSAAARTSQTPIDLTWENDRAFRVRISGGVDLDWRLTLASTHVTALMNALAGVLPEPVWRMPWFLRVMGRVASVALAAGRLRLDGRVPNGQRFLANPRRIWMVSASQASLGGVSFGAMAPLPTQTHLADFWLPQRGIFALAQAFIEPYNATSHTLPSGALSISPPGTETRGTRSARHHSHRRAWRAGPADDRRGLRRAQ